MEIRVCEPCRHRKGTNIGFFSVICGAFKTSGFALHTDIVKDKETFWICSPGGVVYTSDIAEKEFKAKCIEKAKILFRWER